MKQTKGISIMQFIRDNILCIFLVGLGLLCWIITIMASRASKKTGHYVSGVPGVGGILIIIGFLTSPVKWLALIGLLDFHLWYFVVRVIPGIILIEREERNYIPPEELEGGKVVEYSQRKKEFEYIIKKNEPPYANASFRINRYVIIERDGRYILLKYEHNIKLADRIECDTIEDCKKHASPKAKWIKR